MKNTEVTLFNLNEARKQIADIAVKIESGVESKDNLRSDFSEAVWHVFAAWNGFGKSFRDVSEMASDEFVELGSVCPEVVNFKTHPHNE